MSHFASMQPLAPPKPPGRTRRRTSPRQSWGFDIALFALVAVTALTVAVAVLGMMTIGIFVTPVAAVLLAACTVLMGRHPHARYCLAGVLFAPALGLGIVATWINSLWSDRQWCSSDGSCSNVAPANPASWNWPMMGAAVLVVLISVAVFLHAGRRARAH